MKLQLYDTLTRSKRDFDPVDRGRVSMYVCGPTVYDHVHIGNARPVVVFDVLFRLLRHLYGEDAVVYARNITDVDDKINAKAAAEGVDIRTVTDRFAGYYAEQMAALGNLSPTHAPRATDHIADMVAMITRLVETGFAYAAEGHVLFDTQAYPDYGKLSGRPMDEMIAGARVEVAPYKRHPADFVMWKPSKPGEPVWESPYGPGRPGWHIECSAMIEAIFGEGPIDIHGGGIDLVFPHHENERAQSCCAQDEPRFANYWLHNGFLDFSGEKMSKSLGNVMRPHDLLKDWDGEVLRWALLSAHYRQPLDWTPALLEQSKAALDRLYGVLQDANRFDPTPVRTEIDEEDVAGMIDNALSDDLNTPKALGLLFAMADDLRAAIGDPAKRDKLRLERTALVQSAGLLGLLQQDPDAWFSGGADDDLKAKVEALLAERVTARATKDFARADAIRGELDGLGVVVMDSAAGATWRMK